MAYKKDSYDTFWERIGETDPYFGVITNEEYLTKHIDE